MDISLDVIVSIQEDTGSSLLKRVEMNKSYHIIYTGTLNNKLGIVKICECYKLHCAYN